MGSRLGNESKWVHTETASFKYRSKLAVAPQPPNLSTLWFIHDYSVNCLNPFISKGVETATFILCLCES